MITCAIIEDDFLASQTLCSLIREGFAEQLNLIGSAPTVKDGLNLIHQKSPELVFLDIELPDQNGFSLFSYFPSPCFEVIFTTSSKEYAISAIKHAAVDYLIKPVNSFDLKSAIGRFEKKKENLHSGDHLFQKVQSGASYQEKIALPVADGFQVFQFNEILYCQASENYSYVHTISGESFLITKTLKNMEELLPSCCFFRIHKSTLLNINYVKSFSKRYGCTVTLENGMKFDIATRRQDDFINLFMHKKPNNLKSIFQDETLN